MIQKAPGVMLRLTSSPIAFGMFSMSMNFLMRSCMSLVPVSAPSHSRWHLESSSRSSVSFLYRMIVSISIVPFQWIGTSRSTSVSQNSRVRFSATPKLASWKRSTSKPKRWCSSATSSASCLPGIAFQRRPVTSGEQQKVQGSGQPKLENIEKPLGGFSGVQWPGSGKRCRTFWL